MRSRCRPRNRARARIFSRRRAAAGQYDPRLALIIGNGKYSEVPLKNAPNDAKAMAEHLTRMGFDVTLKLDATRADMIETIHAFGTKLAKQKAVGLFYFAGHGAQLAWRNYLIPVDAKIKNVGDIDAQGVDMDTLLTSMTRAQNPMNDWSYSTRAATIRSAAMCRLSKKA